MNYLAHINARIRETIGNRDRFVSFGQNIAAGSHLSGLTRDLPRGDGLQVINMPNCENGLVGFGFGMMLEGIDCAFFCKQFDFLLLACDQLVNTCNMVRLREPKASFAIVCILVDSGYEGPQSRLNALTDFSSIADIPTFAVSNGPDADAVLSRHLIAPGFRIIAVSQRLFRTEVQGPGPDFADVSGGKAQILRHAVGDDATIVSFNMAYPQAFALRAELARQGLAASHYSVPGQPVADWAALIEEVRRTGRLILVDDSRSRNRIGDGLRAAIADARIDCAVAPAYRPIKETDISPNADQFTVNAGQILSALGQATRHRATGGPQNG